MRFGLLALLFVVVCGAASGQAAQSSALGRSAEERVAQWLAAIVPVSASRDWAAAQAAFPGARWEARTSDTRPTVVRDGITYPSQLESLGYTDLIDGSVDLNGELFRIEIVGTTERVTGIRLNAPEGVIVDRGELRRALLARGVGWRLLRCDFVGAEMTQTIVELTASGRSAIFQDSFSGEASAYMFGFDGGLHDPDDPPGACPEAAVRDLR